MDEATIVKEFDQPPPRRVCLKQDSPEAGVGLKPWHFFGELVGCGGIILGSLLVLALIPAFRQEALIAAALFTGAVSILALLQLSGSLSEVRYHRRLARHGEAVIGQVMLLTSVQLNDDTPVVPLETTIEYRFRTRQGREVIEKRRTCSGWYKALVQDGQVVVVYLPGEPTKNEPYNSLKYHVCE